MMMITICCYYESIVMVIKQFLKGCSFNFEVMCGRCITYLILALVQDDT